MPKVPCPKAFLRQAKEKEREHYWLDAAELHKKALDYVMKGRDFWKAGDIEHARLS